MAPASHKEIVRRYRAAHNTNHLQLLDDIVAPDLSAHNLLPGLPPGLAGGKLVHQVAVAAFPDLRVTTEELIAEGDKVAERWTQTGTHAGAPFMGAAASGRTFAVTGMSIYRIADGRIIEHWGAIDTLGLLQQLGLTAAPD